MTFATERVAYYTTLILQSEPSSLGNCILDKASCLMINPLHCEGQEDVTVSIQFAWLHVFYILGARCFLYPGCSALS